MLQTIIVPYKNVHVNVLDRCMPNANCIICLIMSCKHTLSIDKYIMYEN